MVLPHIRGSVMISLRRNEFRSVHTTSGKNICKILAFGVFGTSKSQRQRTVGFEAIEKKVKLLLEAGKILLVAENSN